MVKKYFGTDGIRGRVGGGILTAEFVLRLGHAAGRVLGPKSSKNTLIIGKDTRVSGYMFESALEAGLSAAGCHIMLLGPMPTPAIAWLTRTMHASAGIVISASHNPYHDNGIKFFNASGEKLSDADELAIEALLDQPMQTAESAHLGKARRIDDAAGRYIEYCKNSFGRSALDGLKIVIDCAHGACYHIAPNVFSELGADVVTLGVQPDGFNINADCGSTHPEVLAEKVLDVKADVGIALDGDGDRVVMVDHTGQVVDGDQLIYLVARHLHSTGRLHGGVVGTVMSNQGMENGLRELGIEFVRAAVGDRHVHQQLTARGWLLGGESSGHILNLDVSTTGDGIISALMVLRVMLERDRSLSELSAEMDVYPQVLENIVCDNPSELASHTELKKKADQIDAQLGDAGRVLIRASGTEPKLRIMVEARDADRARHCVNELITTTRSLLDS